MIDFPFLIENIFNERQQKSRLDIFVQAGLKISSVVDPFCVRDFAKRAVKRYAFCMHIKTWFIWNVLWRNMCARQAPYKRWKDLVARFKETYLCRLGNTPLGEPHLAGMVMVHMVTSHKSLFQRSIDIGYTHLD